MCIDRWKNYSERERESVCVCVCLLGIHDDNGISEILTSHMCRFGVGGSCCVHLLLLHSTGVLLRKLRTGFVTHTHTHTRICETCEPGLRHTCSYACKTTCVCKHGKHNMLTGVFIGVCTCVL